MKQKHWTTQQMVLYALGMAIVFVATFYMKIPNALNGYFNLGDGFILLFASIVDPLGGFLIGGLGSALADLAGGYAYYFLPTLLIKGLEGFLVAWLLSRFGEKAKWGAYGLGCTIMVVGYFLAKWYLKGNMWVALSGIPENMVQASVGYVIAIVALPIVTRSLKGKLATKERTYAK